MYPSFPNFTQHTNHSIRFSVPNKNIVVNILEQCEDDENLRLKAAGNVLYRKIEILSRLLLRHRIVLKKMSANELGVTLFLPPPPCPEPKSIF